MRGASTGRRCAVACARGGVDVHMGVSTRVDELAAPTRVDKCCHVTAALLKRTPERTATSMETTDLAQAECGIMQMGSQVLHCATGQRRAVESLTSRGYIMISRCSTLESQYGPSS